MKKIYIILLSSLLLTGCAQNVQKNGGEPANELINYQNTEYGFSLNYPKDWFINESPNPTIDGAYVKLTLVAPERKKRLEETGGYEMASADIYISIFESASELPNNESENLNLEAWLQKEGANQALFEIEKVAFAGSPSFSALSGSADEADPEIYVEHGGRIYLIHSEIGNESQKTQNEKIIQTFKWLN